ncbi:hypothetical protein HGRIS_002664 [Hohenbuehelia grisea]|uniref:Ribosomal protein S6 n=1 Tax=Hohenbuehelia grisea TaxID=104357 RepID=A0ABR3JL43_9AGAR
MPTYQMLCITRHFKEYQHIRELVRQSAMHVMDKGGIVRNLNYWGTLTLPQRMRRHNVTESTGDYWTMHFDTSPRTLRGLNSIMRRDPRVLRWTVLSLGSKIEDVAAASYKNLKGTYNLDAEP